MSKRFGSVEELLADARSRLSRLRPSQAAEAVRAGARLVDIRPSWQREREGEIPGSLIVERNHLEWRLHPESDARVPLAVVRQRWIVFCSEGYTSSLAADALLSLAYQRPTSSAGTPGGARTGCRRRLAVRRPSSSSPGPRSLGGRRTANRGSRYSGTSRPARRARPPPSPRRRRGRASRRASRCQAIPFRHRTGMARAR
jgi:rhodanese-related sulfurtransferase